VAGVEAYLRAKFHLDPSNHLATTYQHHRQTDRQTGQDRTGQDRTGETDRQGNGPIAQSEPFYKRSPKNSNYGVHIDPVYPMDFT